MTRRPKRDKYGTPELQSALIYILRYYGTMTMVAMQPNFGKIPRTTILAYWAAIRDHVLALREAGKQKEAISFIEKFVRKKNPGRSTKLSPMSEKNVVEYAIWRHSSNRPMPRRLILAEMNVEWKKQNGPKLRNK